MFLKTTITASIFMAAAMSAAIGTERFSIPQSVDLPVYSFEGREIDIIGFKPGMAAADALQLLQEHKKGEDVRYMEMYIGTRDVESEYFPSLYYSWQREEEAINVFLTSPSAGNQVYAVSRSLDFESDQRPKIDDLLAGLVQKYGDPDNQYDRVTNTQSFAWYFGGQGRCELEHLDIGMARVSELCVMPHHTTGPSIDRLTYTPRKAKHYLETMGAGSDVVVVASIVAYRDDGKANRIVMSFVDLKRRALSAEADIKLLEQEQAEFNQIEVAIPKL